MEYCTVENAKIIVRQKYEKAKNDLRLAEKGFVMPNVVWRSMGVRRAGTCNYSTNTIELNSDYLKSKDWQRFLDETPLHELAHAISYQVYGEHGHKRVWKSVSISLGLKGNRCHDFERPEGVRVITRKRKTYSAYCPCGEHIISSVKYNRIMRGIDYICVRCKQRISVA